MEHFLPFFITLLAGLVFSVTFKKIQIPWVVTLIVAGITIGPHGLNLFTPNETIDFIAQSGLVLMMFMAGLETQLSSFKKFKTKLYLLSFINGFIPFCAGLGIGLLLGYELIPSLLLGIIFISSSVAVVIPSLESNKLLATPLGSSVLATSIVQDVASLVLLSVFLQTEQNLANLPLFIFYPLVIAILLMARILLPKTQRFLFTKIFKEDDAFQRDLREVLLLLFGMVLVFELLGLHAIIAGFFTGLVLSESLRSEILLGKIRAISYGIFIPTFFITVGLETDISYFYEANTFLYATLLIVGGSILSKIISGFVGAKVVGFNSSQSFFFGVSSVPQLSTTLAATFTAQQFGLLSDDAVTAAVILSVVSTIVGPSAMAFASKFILTKKDIKRADNV